MHPDVVVIGAGIVGAACAAALAEAGLAVTVLERGPIVAGTSGAGEGNLLVSDKEPGPELDLALLSYRLWGALEPALAERIELADKGGLVVASTPDELAALGRLAAAQRAAGVDAVAVDDLAGYEPHLAPGLAGGVFYPQDRQVQPMLAAAHLLRSARVRPHTPVTGLLRGRDGRLTGVRTPSGDLAAGAVVNAAGVWAGEVAALAGVSLPVLPRRGFVLVTVPVGTLVRHKVYAAGYVADVASDAADLQTSPVVEGTPAGTILIGASRERVGFDREVSLPVLRRLAAQAVALFPVLARVPALRAYRGFRPYCPDHLPVIGPDPRAPGLYHACGHEGAGIGLAPATGRLIAQQVTGAEPDLDPYPFRPDRFAAAA
ncbi:MAG: NAD(P)/FAD-dependent oxidoreductase [Mycobacteriales bacterium]